MQETLLGTNATPPLSSEDIGLEAAYLYLLCGKLSNLI